jgi:hypothetical protein
VAWPWFKKTTHDRTVATHNTLNKQKPFFHITYSSFNLEDMEPSVFSINTKAKSVQERILDKMPSGQELNTNRGPWGAGLGPTSKNEVSVQGKSEIPSFLENLVFGG